MEKTLQFLRGLKSNNDRSWMSDHFGEMEQAREQLLELTYELMQGLKSFDPKIDTDIEPARFLSNLTIAKPKKQPPFRTYFEIAASPLLNGGNEPLYLVRIQPEQPYLSIYYQPDVFGLQVLRSHIAKNLDSFQAIIDSLQADGFYLEQQHRLASLPKGYPENSPAAAFIKLQCYQFSSPLDLSSDRGTILSNIITSFKAGYPMVQFLRRGLGLD